MVETAGRPSGIAAAAKLTAVINIVIRSLPYNTPTTNISTQIANAATARYLPN